MILDDGGDATLLVHKGVEFEKAGAVPDPPAAESEELAVCCRSSHVRSPRTLGVGRIANGIRGVTEETTTGVHRLYQMLERGELLFPAINVNDSVTKSKFDNKYGCRHSLDRRHQPGDRRAHRRQGRSRVRIRRRRKGLCRVPPRPGARVIVTEIDPICALQAAMDGYQVATVEDVVGTADIFVTATGNRSVITAEQMAG